MMMKDDWEGLDAYKDNVNSNPKYLRKAIDILSRSKGYTNADVITLADSIDKVSHGYGIFGKLPEKDARENWLDFIKRENAEDILSPDDFYYGDELEGEDIVDDNRGPTGIADPADGVSRQPQFCRYRNIFPADGRSLRLPRNCAVAHRRRTGSSYPG